MIGFTLHSAKFKLDKEELVWSSDNEDSVDFVQSLNLMTQNIAEDLSPANGDPIVIVFNRIVDLIGEVHLSDVRRPVEPKAGDLIY